MQRTTRPSAPSAGGSVVVPSQYREDALDHLCEQLMLGFPLNDICSDPLMPSRAVIMRWLNSDAGFKQRYLEALRVRALSESTQLIDIADGVANQRIIATREHEGEDGELIVENVYAAPDTARDKLRIDTRMKLLAKLEPEVFGDKVEHDHNVTGELAAMLAGAKNQGHKLPNG